MPASWLRVALVVLAACAPQVLLGLGRLGEPADGTATFPSAPAWGDGVVLAEVIGQTGDLGRAIGSSRSRAFRSTPGSATHQRPTSASDRCCGTGSGAATRTR